VCVHVSSHEHNSISQTCACSTAHTTPLHDEPRRPSPTVQYGQVAGTRRLVLCRNLSTAQRHRTRTHISQRCTPAPVRQGLLRGLHRVPARRDPRFGLGRFGRWCLFHTTASPEPDGIEPCPPIPYSILQSTFPHFTFPHSQIRADDEVLCPEPRPRDETRFRTACRLGSAPRFAQLSLRPARLSRLRAGHRPKGE